MPDKIHFFKVHSIVPLFNLVLEINLLQIMMSFFFYFSKLSRNSSSMGIWRIRQLVYLIVTMGMIMYMIQQGLVLLRKQAGLVKFDSQPVYGLDFILEYDVASVRKVG